MPRAAKANVNALFEGRDRLPRAEKILRSIENSRDAYLLMEMNGGTCAGRQVSRLRWYDQPAQKSSQE